MESDVGKYDLDHLDGEPSAGALEPLLLVGVFIGGS